MDNIAESIAQIEGVIGNSGLIPRSTSLLYPDMSEIANRELSIGKVSIQGRINEGSKGRRLVQLLIKYGNLLVFDAKETNEHNGLPRYRVFEVRTYHPGKNECNWEKQIHEAYSKQFLIGQESASYFNGRFSPLE